MAKVNFGTARAVDLIWTSLVFLLAGCHRVLGAQVKSFGSFALTCGSALPLFCFCPDTGRAFGFHCGIITVKVLWSPGLLISDL